MTKKEDIAFKEFYWGAIRAVHEGCPFMQLSKIIDATITPKILRRCPVDDAIPFFAELPIYFKPETLSSDLEEVHGLKITHINADYSRNKTLIMGLTTDELINSVLMNDTFNRMNTGEFYSQVNFEVLPVLSLDREDLFAAEKIIKEEAKKQKGDAYLDAIGRVTSLRDLWYLQDAFVPQPPAVPGLSIEEARVLEAAIAYGYYEVPRKVNLEELAKKMAMTKPTLNLRLRTIENRIVNNTLFQKERK
jgi:predicted DNA binding protein